MMSKKIKDKGGFLGNPQENVDGELYHVLFVSNGCHLCRKLFDSSELTEFKFDGVTRRHCNDCKELASKMETAYSKRWEVSK